VTRAVVYRAWTADRELLYVGMSANPFLRLSNHAPTQPWWAEVTEVTLEHFDDLEAARQAEAAAIAIEGPKYNVRHSARPRRRLEDKATMTRLEYLRREAGFSPEELSDALDTRVTGMTIRRLESGTKGHPSTLRALADFFGISTFQVLVQVAPMLEEDAA
jgi:hypothetical protein